MPVIRHLSSGLLGLFLCPGSGGLNVDGKFRTDHTAHTAPVTLRAVTVDNVIALAINLRRLVESVFWAELDAEATLLTPLGYHVNLVLL